MEMEHTHTWQYTSDKWGNMVTLANTEIIYDRSQGDQPVTKSVCSDAGLTMKGYIVWRTDGK